MTAKFKQGDRVKRTGPHSAIYDNAYDPNGPERFRESEMGDMGTVDYHRDGVHVDWDKGNRSVIAAGALTLVTDETESKRVPIAHMSELQAGDVVETPYSRATLHAYVTREVEVPKEPEGPQPGTFGTAIVDGERRHGALDEDGDFVYSYWVEVDDYLESGSLALKGHFEDFQPYEI